MQEACFLYKFQEILKGFKKALVKKVVNVCIYDLKRLYNKQDSCIPA